MALMGMTTTTLENLKADPTVGRAESLRRAMLAYLNDISNPQNAYPRSRRHSRLSAKGRRPELSVERSLWHKAPVRGAPG
jgi:hypothetical protein